jgi:hypothetical protein
MSSASLNTAVRLITLAAAGASGLWVAGSMPRWRSFFLMKEFQKFFTSLSVRPGSCAAICDHLLPRMEWRWMMRSSSSWEKAPLFRSGRR